MQIAVSYFYQIRFFKENMIPVSTAIWDPKWFHKFKDDNYNFKDKNNIVNGIRSKYLYPKDNINGELCYGPENCKINNSRECEFLKKYKEQLENTDINDILKELGGFARKVQKGIGFKEEPIIVLMVYEIPDNPCSERNVLIDYFNSHGIYCDELKYPIIDNY